MLVLNWAIIFPVQAYRMYKNCWKRCKSKFNSKPEYNTCPENEEVRKQLGFEPVDNKSNTMVKEAVTKQVKSKINPKLAEEMKHTDEEIYVEHQLPYEQS